jgi:hypothetical protein
MSHIPLPKELFATEGREITEKNLLKFKILMSKFKINLSGKFANPKPFYFMEFLISVSSVTSVAEKFTSPADQ